MSSDIQPPPADPKAQENSQNRSRTIAYWATTGLLALAMIVSGVMDVLHHPNLVEAMHHLGYPTHLLTLLGIAKFLAVAVIVVPGLPRVKEWAYAGLAIDLVGALWSHILVEDPPAQYAVIYLFLGLLIASHILRPPNRKLLA